MLWLLFNYYCLCNMPLKSAVAINASLSQLVCIKELIYCSIIDLKCQIMWIATVIDVVISSDKSLVTRCCHQQ